MKKSQLITIILLFVAATVLIVMGCLVSKDKKPAEVAKKYQTLSGTTLSPIEPDDDIIDPDATATEAPTLEPGATASPTPVPTPTTVPDKAYFPEIKNSDFLQYNNKFDSFSTGWIDKTADKVATGYITSGCLERLSGIQYVYYTNQDSTESYDIYVTFSMHYEYGYTTKILDLLDEYNIKAVFFVSADYISENSEIVKEIAKRGHVIGNRPFIDNDDLEAMSSEQFAEELLKVEKEYQKIFGEKERMYLYRCDYFSNRTLHVAEALGYTVVFRTYSYYQTYSAYGKNISVADLAKRFNERGLYKGSVDEFVCEQKVYEALPTFFQYGKDEECTFKLVERKIGL